MLLAGDDRNMSGQFQCRIQPTLYSFFSNKSAPFACIWAGFQTTRYLLLDSFYQADMPFGPWQYPHAFSTTLRPYQISLLLFLFLFLTGGDWNASYIYLVVSNFIL